MDFEIVTWCDLQGHRSLAWPNPFRPGAYRLKIISTGLKGRHLYTRFLQNYMGT